VRAGVTALVANMVLNFALLAMLYFAMVPEAARAKGVFAALSATPGLHLALGIASALASYVNLGLLWRWLRRDGVYQPEPGWRRFALRLVLACAALCAVVLAGLYWAPDFTAAPVAQRIAWLLGLVAAGVVAYGATLFAMGWRLRELRGH
jgi:putative peptidoglycan lipid II flippase